MQIFTGEISFSSIINKYVYEISQNRSRAPLYVGEDEISARHRDAMYH